MTSRNHAGGIHHYLKLNGLGGASTVDASEMLGEGHWVHLDAAHPDSRAWLETHTTLIPIAIDALLAEETRPRLATRGNNLLVTLRGINPDADQDLEDMISLRVWCDGTRLISTRLRSLQSTQDIRDAFNEGVGPKTMIEILTLGIDLLLQRMELPLHRLEEDAINLEDQLLEENQSVNHAELSNLRRNVLGLRRFLGPQRETLFALAAAQLEWITDIERIQLRELGERQARHVDLLDHIASRITVAQEEIRNTLTNAMNERMYVMSIAAALFLPLSFFTGLMGINVGGMPGIDDSRAFWIVVGLCLAAISGLLYLFRRRGWW